VGGTWAQAAAVPQARTEVSVATDGARIYLAGGFREAPGGVEAPREVHRYDPGTDRWTTPTLLPQGVNHAGMVYVAGRLFLVGGFQATTFTPTSAVRVWNPATGAWSAGAPLPTPRGALAVVVLDGKIHAIGGNAANAAALDPDEHNPALDGSSVGTHEVYDPATDTWTRLAPLPTGRNHLAAAVLNGRIHAVGGRVGNSFTLTVHEVFDPATGAWVSAPPIPTGRSGIAAASLDGHIYVFGGETVGVVDRTFDDVERYDPTSQSWVALTPMPTPRHGLGAAALNGRIHVLAGGPQPGFAFSAANEVLIPD
jgi:N-acetylneuraminic acid mutarotase